MSDKAVFSIAYSGPALEDGTMDVKDFAPALLSLGNLIDEANRIVNNRDSKVQVRVRADFKKGSFDVTLEVVRSLMEQLSLAIGCDISLSDLLAILGLTGACVTCGGKGLFNLIKEIKGRKIEKAKQIQNNQVELFFVDQSQTVITNNNVYNLYVSAPVQEATQGVVKPLKQMGIDGFAAFDCPAEIQSHNPSFSLNKEEASYFKKPDYVETNAEPEMLVRNSYKGAYSLITVQFEEGYKWRLSNGQDKITAVLKDEGFIYEIEKNQTSFSKDDILLVEVSTTQWRNPDGSLRTENEITKVIEHIKKKEQIAIPFEN